MLIFTSYHFVVAAPTLQYQYYMDVELGRSHPRQSAHQASVKILEEYQTDFAKLELPKKYRDDTWQSQNFMK